MLWWIAIYFLSGINLFIFSSLKPAIHRMGNAPNIMCPRWKEQKESQPYFKFCCKLSKITLKLHVWTNQSRYAFNIPIKITLTTIIIGTSLQFHDGIQLNIWPTLSPEIQLLNWNQNKNTTPYIYYYPVVFFAYCFM